MNLPALPSPTSLTTPAEIAAAGAQVEALASETTDPRVAKDLTDKWAAITEYIRRTSIAGVAQAEATMRRLEARVGELAPAEQTWTGKASTSPAGEVVGRHVLSDFRRLASHPDILEQVIAESTDTDPPSRRKVLRAIDNAREIDDAAAWAKEHNAAVAASGYDPTDDKRRSPILGALLGIVDAAKRIEQVATPADVTWTLDTTKHVGTQLRSDLAAAIDTIQKYREDS